jgi:hypothetical protein
MSNPSHARTTKERQGTPEHVRYEFRMLRKTVQEYLHPTILRKEEPWIGSAILDSVFLHARNLHEFLAYKSSRRDYVRACHFVTNADGTPWTSKLPSVKALLGDINNYRHHLTYSRVTRGRKPWSHTEIKSMWAEIDAAYQSFLALLHDSERKRWQA